MLWKEEKQLLPREDNHTHAASAKLVSHPIKCTAAHSKIQVQHRLIYIQTALKARGVHNQATTLHAAIVVVAGSRQ